MGSVMLLMAVALALSGRSYSQEFPDRSALAVSTGAALSPGNGNYLAGKSAALYVNYEYRITKYLSVNAGDTLWFPFGYNVESRAYNQQPGTTLSPYTNTQPLFHLTRSRTASDEVHMTVRGILPLANDRLEVFIGAGPGYSWVTPGGFNSLSDVVVDAEAGGRFALDKHRRFWLDVSTNFWANWRHNYNRQQWLASTVGVEFRFGRRR